MSQLRRIAVIKKAVDLLRLFSHESPTLTFAEIQKRSGLKKTTAYRLLLTLEETGLLERDPETRGYRLGVALFELGSVVMSQMELRKLSRPVLERLARETGETAYLLVRDGYEALCLERVEGTRFLRSLFLDVGKRMPLHMGAGPRVLLAWCSSQEVDEVISVKGLVAWTPNTIVDPEALRKDLALVREQGYALSLEDVTPAAAALGMPVFDHRGQVVGAISISGLYLHFRGSQLQEYLNHLRLASNELSRKLGWRPSGNCASQGETA